MENYIVRVYRRNLRGPDDVVGYVECVENAQTLPFRGMAELVAIFSIRRGDTAPDSAPVNGREPSMQS